MLVEVNPLIVTPEREVAALDAKVTLDDNALFRHPDNAELRDLARRGPAGADGPGARPDLRQARRRHRHPGQRRRARHETLDVVAQLGGEPANFLDAGGGSKAEAITSAVEVILSDPKVKAVLFNIFGGITRCDEVARRASSRPSSRSSPTCRSSCASTARTTRRAAGSWPRRTCPNVHPATTMNEAAEKVVELAQGGRSR